MKIYSYWMNCADMRTERRMKKEHAAVWPKRRSIFASKDSELIFACLFAVQ